MRLTGITILLVEDDVDNLEVLAMCLEGEGARVLSAGSIAAALAMSLGRRIDVVLSDLDLPDGDGCALLRQLRSREGYAQLPAIAVSGYSQDQWRSYATTCGFDRYAIKPFSIDSLVASVASLVASVAGLRRGGADDENAAI